MRRRIDFPALTGRRTVTIYARTEIVKDLAVLQLADGPTLLFEAEALAVENATEDAGSGPPLVRFVNEGREQTLTCDYVVGCDGFHGIVRDAFPAAVSRIQLTRLRRITQSRSEAAELAANYTGLPLAAAVSDPGTGTGLTGER